MSKNHRYRMRLLTGDSRAVAAGYYGQDCFTEDLNIDTYNDALRNCSRWWGSGSFDETLAEGDLFTQTNACLWGFQAGHGGTDRINPTQPKQHTAADLAQLCKEPAVLFYRIVGSWFIDVNWGTDNFAKATLCTSNYGLATLASRYIDWHLEKLALGEALSTALRDTASATPNNVSRTLRLLGDPTLRLFVTAPASNLALDTNLTGNVTLTWSPSGAPGTTHFVYRSTNGLYGSFNLLTANAVAGTAYVDTSPPPGQKHYQLRSAALVTSGSGSFTNLSQGIFKWIE
jgi:hypothetical protein